MIKWETQNKLIDFGMALLYVGSVLVGIGILMAIGWGIAWLAVHVWWGIPVILILAIIVGWVYAMIRNDRKNGRY